MRLFIGIGLPIPAGESLLNAAHGVLPSGDGGRRVRWTRPDNMHVTLSFLGQVEPDRLKQIQQALAAVRAARLRLELSEISVLGNQSILTATLKPSAGLLALAEQIFLAMERCGFPREKRPYRPHVTLARSKGAISLPPLRRDDPAFRQSFEAREFRLYESITRPEGSHYEVLSAFPLA